jgi:hypothetical protein
MSYALGFMVKPLLRLGLGCALDIWRVEFAETEKAH